MRNQSSDPSPFRSSRIAKTLLTCRERSESCLLRTLDLVVALVGAVWLTTVATVIAKRVGYPFELEWMEGAVLDHVRMLSSDSHLYREPSASFTSFIYPPGYYLVTWLVHRAGVSLMLAGRLVSTLSSLLSTLVIASAVRREGGRPWHVLLAVSGWMASFSLVGGWFDLVRVDSLFLALWFSSVWVARFSSSRWTGVLTGALLVASFFTKQTALLLAVVPVGYLLAVRRRQGLGAAATFAIGLLAGTWLMDRWTGGWFFYYAFALPSQHPMLWASWRILAEQFFWTPVAAMWLLTSALVVMPDRRAHSAHIRWLYVPLVLVSAVSCYLALLHKDGFVNVLMPFYASLALASSVGLVQLDRALSRHRGTALRVRLVSRVVALFALLLIYRDPSYLAPSRQDLLAGQQLIRSLRGLPGPVLMLDTGYYASIAGHPQINANAMAIADVFKSRDGPRKRKLMRELLAEIRSGAFPTIVTGHGWELLPREVRQQVTQSYRRGGRVLPKSQEPFGWPKSGFHTRPTDIWRLR